MWMTRLQLWFTCGILVCVLPGLSLARTVKPADYAAIEKRNPFGLVDPPKPEPPPVVVVPEEKEPPPNVELTGMFHDSVKNQTYALFLVQVKGEPKKRSYMLREGEGQDGLKVERINRSDQNVKINVKGLSSTITYNEPKAVAATKVPGPPQGNVRSAGNRTTRAAAVDRMAATQNAGGGVRQFTTAGRQGTFSGSGRSVSAVAGGMPSMETPDDNQAPSGNNTLRPIPTRQMRTQPQLTRQEQEVLIEAQRAANDARRMSNPGSLPPMPPLPPTSLSTPETLQRITVQPGR